MKLGLTAKRQEGGRYFYFFIFIDKEGQCVKVVKRLILGREAMIDVDQVMKDKDTVMTSEFAINKARDFSVVMHGSEIFRKCRRKKMDAFNLWIWR